jgi:nitrogen regulatory protein P-II 1
MPNINSFDFRKVRSATIVMMRVGSIEELGLIGTDDSVWERTTMTKVEAIIQVSKLDAVKDALHEVGVEGMTVFEARGHGRQKGHTEFYRGREYTVDLIPKVKLEIVVADEMKEKVVQAISNAARTGKIGDGKIFTSHIDEAIRIRNDERGDSVL